MGVLNFLQNTSYGRFAKIIFGSQLSYARPFVFSFIQTSDFLFHICERSFFFSFWPAYELCTSFRQHISSVFKICSKEEMRRINTSRIVAFVTDQKIIFNRTIVNFIRKSMSSFCFSIDLKSTVSTFKFAANPFPTRVKWNKFNSIKKLLHMASIAGFQMGVK